MGTREFLICALLGGLLAAPSTLAAEKPKKSPPQPACDNTLSKDPYFVGKAGKLKNFNLQVKPKFTPEELERNRSELTPRNPKYKLGETGNFEIYAENRMVSGFSSPQIVAVKYEKDWRNQEQRNFDHMFDLQTGTTKPTEIQKIVETLQSQYAVFKELKLLQYFDVLTPLEVGQDYVVMPLVWGQSLSDLTYQELRHLNPPEQFANSNVLTLGPPTEDVHPELARLWSAQQHAVNQALIALKKAGYKVFQRFAGKAWPSKQKYISLIMLTREGHPTLSLRTDQMVTTDGRLVVHDPY
ncbi:MAG: hypothetical protein AB7N80_03945 [Bdellovibrionales bacterium]